jgi:hypothetical protein
MNFFLSRQKSKGVPPVVLSRVRDAAYYAADNEPILVLLFVPSSDVAGVVGMFSAMLERCGKVPDTLLFRNLIGNFLGRFSEYRGALDMEFAMYDFTVSTDRVLPVIGEHLFSKSVEPIDELIATNLSCLLLIFHDSHSGIFRILRDQILNLLQRITPGFLFSVLGVDFLFLYGDRPPIEFLRTAALDFRNMNAIFRSPSIFGCPESGSILQGRAYGLSPFPPESNDIDLWILALVNSALIAGAHFVDCISQNVIEFLIEGRVDHIPLNFTYMRVLAPYVLVGCHSLIFAKLDDAIPLLRAEYPPSVAADCLSRICNDIALMNLMSFLTDQPVSLAELTAASFPKRLEFVLAQEELLNFANFRFLVISDAVVDTDFDFVKGYGIYRLFLSLFQPTLPGQVKQIILDLGKLLGSIRNDMTRQKMGIDLFSLLFL